MDLAVEAARMLQAWLRRTNPRHELETDALRGEALEDELNDDLCTQRVFATPEDPVGMRNAADYSDCWVTSKAGDFNVYYIYVRLEGDTLAALSLNLCTGTASRARLKP